MRAARLVHLFGRNSAPFDNFVLLFRTEFKLSRKNVHLFCRICTFFGVVSTLDFDYDFTTFEVLHMPGFAKIFRKCAFRALSW